MEDTILIVIVKAMSLIFIFAILFNCPSRFIGMSSNEVQPSHKTRLALHRPCIERIYIIYKRGRDIISIFSIVRIP